MKHTFGSILLTAGLACLSANVAPAQTYIVGANIPFAFHANGKDHAPGKYMVEKAMSNVFLVLEDCATGQSVPLSIRQPTESTKGPARLTFNRYGDQYFLSAVWNREHMGVILAVTAREKEVRNSGRQSALAEVLSDVTRTRAGL